MQLMMAPVLALNKSLGGCLCGPQRNTSLWRYDKGFQQIACLHAGANRNGDRQPLWLHCVALPELPTRIADSYQVLQCTEEYFSEDFVSMIWKFRKIFRTSCRADRDQCPESQLCSWSRSAPFGSGSHTHQPQWRDMCGNAVHRQKGNEHSIPSWSQSRASRCWCLFRTIHWDGQERSFCTCLSNRLWYKNYPRIHRTILLRRP